MRRFTGCVGPLQIALTKVAAETVDVAVGIRRLGAPNGSSTSTPLWSQGGVIEMLAARAGAQGPEPRYRGAMRGELDFAESHVFTTPWRGCPRR